MGLPAARLGDPTVHGGVITVGLPTVLIGGQPAARIGDLHTCPMVTVLVPHVGGPLVLGAFTVLVGMVPQSRQTDALICVGPPDAVAMGLPTVLVGMAGGGMGFGAVLGGLVAGLGNFLSNISQPPGPLDSPVVQEAMRDAWGDSQANDPVNRHEEGGYIVQNADGSYGVERWPRGVGAAITPPARAADGSYNGKPVVGEFHTHPNPDVDEAGRHWQEAPSPGDLTGIQAENYPGDSYVVGHNNVHRVGNDGSQYRVGPRSNIIGD